jgi:predicted anti-sigma-YlaC factor YlaD
VSKTWDGEVTERELRLLAAHLKECPACLAEARRMHGFLTRLDRCLKARRRGGAKG